MRVLGVAVAVAAAGCAGLFAGSVSVLQAPAIDAYQGKGCTFAVASLDATAVVLDGAAAGAPSPERRRALASFDERFYAAVSNVDPAHVTRGARGKLVLKPSLRRVTSGKVFSDAASEPTEVWLQLEVLDAQGQLLERFEVHGLQNASAALPTLEDRLPLTALEVGATVGKHVRKQLSCR